MRIDLHTHSDRSDGTESPDRLVRRAHREGIDVLGLTDHDTTEGWAEAECAARDVGLSLVRGIEVSCTFAGYGVHLLAYLPDPTFPPLAEELQRILDGRNSRLPATLEKLRRLGIAIDVQDVRDVAGETAAMGRPHVADALVRLGVVANRDEVRGHRPRRRSRIVRADEVSPESLAPRPHRTGEAARRDAHRAE